MKDLIKDSAKYLPEIVKPAVLDFKVEGWPAAVTVIGISICGTIVYWINVKHEEYVMNLNKESDSKSKEVQEKQPEDSKRKEELPS